MSSFSFRFLNVALFRTYGKNRNKQNTNRHQQTRQTNPKNLQKHIHINKKQAQTKSKPKKNLQKHLNINNKQNQTSKTPSEIPRFSLPRFLLRYDRPGCPESWESRPLVEKNGWFGDVWSFFFLQTSMVL